MTSKTTKRTLYTAQSIIARSIGVWLVAFLVSGCSASSRVIPVEIFSAWGQDRAPVPITNIRIIKKLADDGMGIDRDGNIVIPANYPTESDPHVLIGLYRVGYRSAEKLPEETEREMAFKVAAKHGANAIYDDVRYGSRTFSLLYLSSADAVYPPAPPFLDKLEQAFGGRDYQRYGKDIARTLEGFEPIALPAHTMTCFRAAIALDTDGKLKPDLGSQMQVVIKAKGKKRAISIPLERPLARSRSFLVQLGCYANSQDVSWQLAAYPAERPLGTGPVLVRSFEMPADMRLRKNSCAAMQDTDRATAHDEGMCVP